MNRMLYSLLALLTAAKSFLFGRDNKEIGKPDQEQSDWQYKVVIIQEWIFQLRDG